MKFEDELRAQARIERERHEVEIANLLENAARMLEDRQRAAEEWRDKYYRERGT